MSFIRYMNPYLGRKDRSSLNESNAPRRTIMARFLDAIEMLVHIFLPSWYLRGIGGRKQIRKQRIRMHLSYAEDVLNEITKPRTKPRTVKSWFDTPNFTSVCSETTTTTVNSSQIPGTIRCRYYNGKLYYLRLLL